MKPILLFSTKKQQGNSFCFLFLQNYAHFMLLTFSFYFPSVATHTKVHGASHSQSPEICPPFQPLLVIFFLLFLHFHFHCIPCFVCQRLTKSVNVLCFVCCLFALHFCSLRIFRSNATRQHNGQKEKSQQQLQ